MSIYTDNFETIFGTKSNIQALRNKVLNLAVRGKLVGQVQNDESATINIESIQKKISNKHKMIREYNGNYPFEIPTNWAWSDLASITSADLLSDGDWILSNDMSDSGEIKLIQLGNIGWCSYIEKGYKYLTLNKFKELKCKQILPGYLLINRLIADCMFVCKLPDIDGILITAVDACWIAPNEDFYNIDYLMYLLASPYFQESVKKLGKGMTRLRISKGNLINLPIAFPPLREQARIVTKIKSLMSEIDKLEDSIQNRIHLIKLLPQSIVDAIGGCKTGEELEVQLKFVIDNFESIFQTPESMQDLRNVILQLAIEGKLVPQDDSDEPADELIKKIDGEKLKMIKDGGIRNQPQLKPIEKDEIPFEISETWTWKRLGEICNKITDGEHISPFKTENGIPLLSAKNLYGGTLTFENIDYVSLRDAEKFRKRCNPECNDILIGGRGSIGNTVINDTDRLFCLMGSVILVKPLLMYPKYLFYLLKSNYGQIEMKGRSFQTAISALYLKDIVKIIVPIPPLQEQCRIVAKIESMFNLIEQMEMQLKRKSELIEKMAVM